jgi:exonuclease SbcD
MIRFLHAADFHLDSPFASLSPQQAAARRRESRELPARLVRCAADRGADLLLLSGDLFDTAAPYRETGEALCRALGETDLPVFIAPGNHDYCSPESPYARLEWPENVHIFRTGRVESVELPELEAVVHGAAFTAPEQTGEPAGGLSRAPGRAGASDGAPRGDRAPEARYDPLTAGRRSPPASLPIWRWATSTSTRRPGPSGGRWRPGPAARRAAALTSWGSGEFYEGTRGRSGGVELRFVPFARHRYSILTVDVTDAAPWRRCPGGAAAGDGGGPVPPISSPARRMRAPLDLPALREALEGPVLRPGAPGRDPPCGRTSGPGRGRTTLRGLFLRRAAQKAGRRRTEQERDAVQQAARFGLAALDRRDLG